MTVEEFVLLARPHAFIVGEMRPLPVDAGYAPIRMDRLDQLGQLPGRQMPGAVIRTALTQCVNAGASYEAATKAPRADFG